MSIGVFQLLLILVIVLIVFGSGKLPNVMGDLGKGIRKFKEELKSEEEAKKSKKVTSKKNEKVIEGEVLESKKAKTAKKSTKK